MTATLTLRDMLHAEREHLRARLAGGRQAIAVERHADPADERVEASAREQEAGELRRARGVLADVETAIARWDLCVFGMCCECDAYIGQKRLEAVPWAAFCLACAERREVWQRLGGEANGKG